MQLPSQFTLIRVVAPLAIVMLALTGCGLNAGPTSSPNPSESTQPTVEPSESPVQTEFFSMPADCTAILPASDVAAMAADGIILLAGPGGKYGNELITEPTPEMVAGGISCYFGVDNEDLTLLRVSVLVSAVALDDTSRATVIDDLTTQGLARAMDERGDVTFGILGVSEGQTTANYNVIASDSWISVLSSDGGEAAFLAIVSLANAVHTANYS